MKKITPLQGYNAMIRFFEQYYLHTNSDDAAVFAGGMGFFTDKEPFDIAYWDDWNDGLKKACKGPIEYVTPQEAYLAMFQFLDFYFRATPMAKRAPEIQQLFTQGTLKNDTTLNPIFWQVWMRCVQDTVKKDDPRVYLNIKPVYDNISVYNIIMIFCKIYYNELQLSSFGVMFTDCKIYHTKNEIEQSMWQEWLDEINNTFPQKIYFDEKEIILLTKHYLQKKYFIPMQKYSDHFFENAINKSIIIILKSMQKNYFLDAKIN